MAHQRYTNNLTHDDRQKGDYNVLAPIVQEAKEKRVWLYHKKIGRWYTPEEFEARYSLIFTNRYDIRQLQENIILRDPRSGNAAFQKAIRQKALELQKELNELTQKGEVFLNKVIEYYKG